MLLVRGRVALAGVSGYSHYKRVQAAAALPTDAEGSPNPLIQRRGAIEYDQWGKRLSIDTIDVEPEDDKELTLERRDSMPCAGV